MLNAVLLFLHHTRLLKVCYYGIENIFLYHYTRLSKVCFYAVVKINLKFIAIVNFQHTILSCFTFTAACLFYHLSYFNQSFVFSFYSRFATGEIQIVQSMLNIYGRLSSPCNLYFSL